MIDHRSLGDIFRRDGVVHVPELLDAGGLQLAREAFEWSVAHPTASSTNYYPTAGSVFFQDSFNTAAWPMYRRFIEQSGIARTVQQLLNTREMWFFFEQIFLKEGMASRRTPWHQDSSYLPIAGEQFGILWISLDAVDEGHALEFIPGSHRGPLYNGAAFDPNDETVPIYSVEELPRLPDIEADRSRWNIRAIPVEPGDAILFHPSTLHGGAPVSGGAKRRTLSLRFLGDDVTFSPLPQPLGNADVGFDENGKPLRDMSRLLTGFAKGQPYRHPDLLRVAGSVEADV